MDPPPLPPSQPSSGPPPVPPVQLPLEGPPLSLSPAIPPPLPLASPRIPASRPIRPRTVAIVLAAVVFAIIGLFAPSLRGPGGKDRGTSSGLGTDRDAKPTAASKQESRPHGSEDSQPNDVQFGGIADSVPTGKSPERTQQQLTAIRDFSFSGISFATPMNKIPPSCSFGHADDRLGDTVFFLGNDEVRYCCVYFFDQELRGFQLFYNERDVDRLGGDSAIVDRLKDRFGEMDASTDTIDFWRMPTVDREIYLVRDNKWFNRAAQIHETGTSVAIFNSRVDEARENRKKKLGAGF
jgi:hypothetical protein